MSTVVGLVDGVASGVERLREPVVAPARAQPVVGDLDHPDGRRHIGPLLLVSDRASVGDVIVAFVKVMNRTCHSGAGRVGALPRTRPAPRGLTRDYRPRQNPMSS